MAGETAWRILIVDDYALYRETVRLVLAAGPKFQVVAEAASGEEAVALTRQVSINLVLMDLRLPGMNGLRASQLIKAENAQIIILILSSDWSPLYERRAKAAGILTRLAKQTFSLQLLEQTLHSNGLHSNGL
jgi:DNA-binding NarL/FixJ family response regulator